MSRILTFISLMVMSVIVMITVVDRSNEMIFDFGNIEQRYCEAFVIPERQELEDPEIVFEILCDTARETKSNIIRAFFRDGTSKNSFVYYKYILMGKDNSSYLEYFKLSEGRNLEAQDTDGINSVEYLSTVKSSDQNQKGILCSHMIRFELFVLPLGRSFDEFKVNGVYYVELGEEYEIDSFIDVLSANIEKATMLHLTNDELICETPNGYIPYTDISILKIYFIMILLLWGIYVFYYLLRSKQEISVLKMMGIYRQKIYLKLFRYTLVSLLLFTFVVFLAGMYNGLHYAIYIFTRCIVAYFLIIMFTIASFLICENTTEYSYALKGKKYTKGVLTAQLISEFILILYLLSSGGTLYNELSELNRKLDIYKNWTGADSYGVLAPFHIGDELSIEEEISRDIEMGTDFYYALNDMGTLLIDARDYEDLSRHLDYRLDYQKYVYVNPNYLNHFPWYNFDGKRIAVDESEKNTILLIPDLYRNYENEIIEYYNNTILKGSFEYDKSHYNDCPIPIPNIEIIWTMNGQKLLSFNAEISLESEGIKDPIISVITENNSYITDRIRSYGNGYRDPRKIPIHGSARETYKLLEPILKESKLDDNYTRLISIDNLNTEELAALKTAIRLTIIGIILAIGILILTIYQSSVIVFDMNKKDYCVKKVFGLSDWKIYSRYIMLKVGMMIIETILYTVLITRADSLQNRTIGFYVTEGIIAILIQISFIHLFMGILQRKRQAEILKGE